MLDTVLPKKEVQNVCWLFYGYMEFFFYFFIDMEVDYRKRYSEDHI